MFTAGGRSAHVGRYVVTDGLQQRHIIRDTVRHGAASQSAESGAPGGQAAKGRYMEEEIALPEEIAENGYVGVVQKKDKSLLFAIPDEEGNDRFYSYDAASSWTKGEAIAPLGNIRPAKMFMDQNEKLYFGGFDQENYTFHLWTVQEDGTVQELLPGGV